MRVPFAACGNFSFSTFLTAAAANSRDWNVRHALAIVHPGGGGQALVHRRQKVRAGVEVEHEEQVACGASHSARAKTALLSNMELVLTTTKKISWLKFFTLPSLSRSPAPPDVGLGHDVLQPVAELEEGLDLETHG